MFEAVFHRTHKLVNTALLYLHDQELLRQFRDTIGLDIARRGVETHLNDHHCNYSGISTKTHYSSKTDFAMHLPVHFQQVARSPRGAAILNVHAVYLFAVNNKTVDHVEFQFKRLDDASLHDVSVTMLVFD